jgi:hypothetical protein
MKPRRPVAIKLLATVAGFMMLWPILFDLHVAFALLGEGLPFVAKLQAFRIVFGLTYGEIIDMALWAGLLVSTLMQSRWALAFAGLLSLLAIAGLLAIWSVFGGIVGPTGFTGYTLLTIAIAITPLLVLEETIRLWRQGAIK